MVMAGGGVMVGGMVNIQVQWKNKENTERRKKMKVSDCCGANFYEPGYPDIDICTECGEHAEPMKEEEEE